MPTPLEEFEKKLYKRGEGETKKRRGYEVYKEEDVKIVKEGWDEGAMRQMTSRVRKKDLKILLFLLAFSAAVAWGYYWYVAEEPFRTRDVVGELAGPDRVTAGDEISFAVTYRNNTDAVLREAQLFFMWPEGALPAQGASAGAGSTVTADIGTLLPGQEKSATFKGRAYGSKDDAREVQAIFRYVPEGFTSAFEDKQTFSFTIVSTPFALSVDIPAQVVSEKELEVTIEYQNQSDARFDRMRVRVTYPAGFQFVSADPPPAAENALWELGAVEGRAGGKIALKGSFSGVQGETKSLFAEIGRLESGDEFVQYASASGSLTIASSALFVFQTVNDSRDFAAHPGASLQYKIRYRNTTNVQIPNVVILAQIDEAYVDIRSLNVQWGSFDGRTNSLIWNSVGVPDLAILDPKEEGQVSFTLNLKPVFLPKSFSDKNLTVASTAKITSSVPPDSLSGLPIESGDTLEVKINTQFSFNEKAYFAGGPLQNSGPIPPRVGQRTTFAVSWQLSNTSNDVGDIEVQAVIPPNVEWTGAVDPPGAPISFDQNTGMVMWKPEKVFAGAGILLPAARVDFQVAFTPALVHVGQMVNLTSGATLKAADTFTGLKIERQAPAVNSDLLNSLKGEEGRITQ